MYFYVHYFHISKAAWKHQKSIKLPCAKKFLHLLEVICAFVKKELMTNWDMEMALPNKSGHCEHLTHRKDQLLLPGYSRYDIICLSCQRA